MRRKEFSYERTGESETGVEVRSLTDFPCRGSNKDDNMS